jgi:O-antigen/teichoic acid export membrane protein
VDSDELLRIGALCVLLACAETLHGIARIKVFIPRIGKERAIKISAVTGTLIAFAICYLFVPGIGLQSAGAHLILGLTLAAFMAGFDIAIGRWLMRKSWAKIWPDFDPRTGNYLLYGLLALCLIPLFVWYIHASWRTAA